MGRLTAGTPLGDLKVLQAYVGLIKGAFGSPQAIATTLIKATPYIFAGLAVALAFKCGLFNIGAEGQIALGALCSAFVGYSLHGVPICDPPAADVVGGVRGRVRSGGRCRGRSRRSPARTK